jgi:hypothetical protein
MKKIVFFAIIACFAAVSAFGQHYTVQSVNGQVQRESGSRRVNIRAGETLSANTIIHTALGASVVLRQGDETITIPAARSGRISDLAAQITQGTETEADITVSRVVSSPTARTAGQISTASARASRGAVTVAEELEAGLEDEEDEEEDELN